MLQVRSHARRESVRLQDAWRWAGLTALLVRTLHGSFRKLGVPYFGVLMIRILLFVVLYEGPLFSETPKYTRFTTWGESAFRVWGLESLSGLDCCFSVLQYTAFKSSVLLNFWTCCLRVNLREVRSRKGCRMVYSMLWCCVLQTSRAYQPAPPPPKRKTLTYECSNESLWGLRV